MDKEIQRQFDFSVKIDCMTHILRHTPLIDNSRLENDAEHSWHIAVMALIFAQYAIEKVNTEHSVSLCIVHDLIEIYAGDTFAYDKEANATKTQRESESAKKLFSMLPQEDEKRINALWREFEECQTPEAKLANCMDRLQPFLHNIKTNGTAWLNSRKQNMPISATQVRQRLQIVKDFLPALSNWIETNITDSVEKGYISN